MGKKRVRRFVCTMAGLVLCAAAWADYGLKVVAPWRAQPAKKFTVEGGVVRADGVPFPLIMDFTWSAPHDSDFLRYDVQLLGTAHYMGTSLSLESPQNWRGLDSVLALCERNRIYYTAGLGVAHQGGYLSRHPEARMMGPGGAEMHRRYVCFLDPGYRKALGKALAELAAHLRDKPYVLGYYPQDEFSYPGFGGYNPISVSVFRQRIVKKYRGLAKLNAAWKTKFARADDIEPPLKPETTVRWADWQEFRRWAYFDFCSFVYRTLKEHDPNHLVIWSLDFWGSARTATSWWQMPKCSDVLMRHGIGYKGGAFRFQLVREIAEWSKKPGSALAMPPGYYAPYEKFSLLLDASRTGISYVCAGGGDEHLYYRGAADSDRGYKRREPGYTTARSFNQLVHLMGDTYLESERRAPQVGFFVSDRTTWIAGVRPSSVNGILNLLGDINLDFEIVSEHNFGDLGRFKTLIAGPAIQLASDEIVSKIEAYVRAGGGLILMPGAFERDENNVPVTRKTFALFEQKAVPAKTIAIGEQSFPVDRRTPVRPIAKSAGARGIARTDTFLPAAARARLGRGEILAVGWDVGTPYLAAWVKDFAGVGEKENTDAVEDNAYANMRPERVAEGAVSLLPQRAVAAMFRDFAREHGARETVRCKGYTDAIAALRCRSFRQGKHYTVGIANRMVKPGRKFAETWPSDYHVAAQDLAVSLRLDEPAESMVSVVMPLARPRAEGWSAMPRLLDVRTERAGGENLAHFTLPRLDDAAMVVVSPGYGPVMGAATDRRSAVAGDTIVLTGRIVNPSARPVAGVLFADVDQDALTPDGTKKSFRIGPGGKFDAAFPIKISRTAKQGYYLAQAVARLDHGATFRSPGLEVNVIPVYELSVTPEGRTFYPELTNEKPLTVGVRPHAREVRGEVSLAIEGAPDFPPDARTKTLAIDGTRDEYKASFTFGLPKKPHLTETATLVIKGTVGGLAVKRTQAIRLARGTVAYREEKIVRLSNARPEGSVVSLVTLENPRIKVRIIPQTAVVHELVLRETNNDLLAEGTYPFGLVWYAWKGGWRLKEMGPSGPEVRAVFASRAPNGKPVTMTASLRGTDPYTTITYDASASAPVKQAFYLMSRLGKHGTHIDNLMCVPTRQRMLRRLWRKARSSKTISAADFAEPWMAVLNESNGQVFSVSFDFDHLDHVNVSSGKSNFNYMIFYLDPDQAPGRIVFRLAGQMGGLDQAQALQRALIKGARE